MRSREKQRPSDSSGEKVGVGHNVHAAPPTYGRQAHCPPPKGAVRPLSVPCAPAVGTERACSGASHSLSTGSPHARVC